MGAMTAAGKYIASPPTYTDGQEAPITLDANGRILTAIAAGTNNIGDVDIASIAAGTTYIGQTSSPMQYVTITPTVLNADAYDANDVIFDTTAIAGATRAADVPGILTSICYVDKDDNAAANLTFWFLSANVSFGTADSAPSISDANALNLLGYVSMASASILDVGGAKVGFVGNLWFPVIPATGTTTVYVAMTSAGTPTHTTGGVQVRLGFLSN